MRTTQFFQKNCRDKSWCVLNSFHYCLKNQIFKFRKTHVFFGANSENQALAYEVQRHFPVKCVVN